MRLDKFFFLMTIAVSATNKIHAGDHAKENFTVLEKITDYSLPESWPTQFDRPVVDMAPKGARARVDVIGT